MSGTGICVALLRACVDVCNVSVARACVCAMKSRLLSGSSDEEATALKKQKSTFLTAVLCQ